MSNVATTSSTDGDRIEIIYEAGIKAEFFLNGSSVGIISTGLPANVNDMSNFLGYFVDGTIDASSSNLFFEEYKLLFED